MDKGHKDFEISIGDNEKLLKGFQQGRDMITFVSLKDHVAIVYNRLKGTREERGACHDLAETSSCLHTYQLPISNRALAFSWAHGYSE